MYKPKEFKFCFHVDVQQVHVKLAKSAVRRWLIGSEKQWVPVHYFFQLR